MLNDWSKLDSEADLTAPQIGTGFTKVGTPTFQSAKFGYGIYGGYTNNNGYFSFTPGSVFVFDFWCKMLNASSTNGFIAYNEVYHAMEVQVYNGVIYIGLDSQYSSVRYTFNISYSAGEKVHFGLVFDQSNTNKVRFFKNGVEVTKNSALQNTIWTSDTKRFNMYGANNTFCVIDNFKYHTDLKTDFSDRFWEDGAGIPANVTASNGTYSDKTTISWDEVVGDLTAYRVYRSDTSGGSFVDISGAIDPGISTFDDTTGVSGTHYFYKVRSETSTANSDLSSEVEGWYGTESIIYYNNKTITYPRVLIFDRELDIYKLGFINKTIPLVEERTSGREGIYTSAFEIEVNNDGNFFSISNSKSPFYGMAINQPVKIYDSQNNLIFNGVIENVRREYAEGKKAFLCVSDLLYKWSKKNVYYISSDWETPANAFKNICSYIGFTDLDLNLVSKADALYVKNSCYIKCNFKLDEPVDFQTVLAKISDICCADIYVSSGKLVFRHWEPYSGTTTIGIDEADLISMPAISDMADYMKNNYSALYYGCIGVPTTDADNNNIGAGSRSRNGDRMGDVLDCSEEGQVILKDKTSAVYLCEAIIKRSHIDLSTNPRPVVKVDISLLLEKWSWLTLEDHVMFTFEDEGWINKLFEIVRIEKNEDENKINVSLYEVQT